MYEFRDLAIDRRLHQEEMPIEALNFNGHWLDKEVAGYQTLVTSGRQAFTRQVNSVNRVGDGSTYLSSRLEERKITVTFIFHAKNIDEYNKRLSKLRQILSEPNQSFYFADMQDYHFTGTVTELSLDNDTLNTTGKIVIETTDPYLYGYEKYASADGTSISIDDKTLVYMQTPKRLVFKPTTTVGNLKLTCGDKKIELSIGVAAGQPVAIDFEKLNVAINYVDSLMDVTLDSNLGDFYIKDGSVISANTNGHFDLIYEVKTL